MPARRAQSSRSNSCRSTPTNSTRCATAGSTDTETVGDAMRNIFGVAWNVARAAAPAMARGRVDHQRLDDLLAHALLRPRRLCRAQGGDERLVARTIARTRPARRARQPGVPRTDRERAHPHASSRRWTQLRGDDTGHTADAVLRHDVARTQRPTAQPKAKTFPTPDDIAATCVFLGSDESAAYTGHDFEVTHGMTVRKEARSTYLSRPTMRSMDGAGLGVLIAAGDGWEDALEIARVQMACGAACAAGLAAPGRCRDRAGARRRPKRSATG